MPLDPATPSRDAPAPPATAGAPQPAVAASGVDCDQQTALALDVSAPAAQPQPWLITAILLTAGYLALALLATWPLALHLGSHVPGGDFWQGRRLYFESPVNLWNLWWFRYSLLSLGTSPFHCSLIFYPQGANLWLHTLAPLHAAIGLVLQSFLSLAASQNALLLATFVASGACTWLLARELGVAPGGAFVAGALFAFSAPVMGHLRVGHFELIATEWLPLALWLFLRLVERPRARWGTAIALGLTFAAAAYSAQYYAVYGAELSPSPPWCAGAGRCARAPLPVCSSPRCSPRRRWCRSWS